MRRPFAILLILLLALSASASTTIIRRAAGGAVSPDHDIDHEDTESTCEGGTGYNGTSVAPDCDHTTTVYAGSESMECSSTTLDGSYITLTDGDDVWWETAFYTSETPVASQARMVTVGIDAAIDIIWGYRDNSGYKYAVRDYGTTWTYSSGAPTGGQWVCLRGYVTRSAAAGVTKFWSDTGCTGSWTLEINATGGDTDSGSAYNIIYFGRNAGNPLPHDWYFDDVKVWDGTDPGW